MKTRKSTPLSYFSQDNYVDVNESDVENQVQEHASDGRSRTMYQLPSSEYQFYRSVTDCQHCASTLGLTCIRCCTAIIHSCVDMYRHNLPPQNEVASTAYDESHTKISQLVANRQ